MLYGDKWKRAQSHCGTGNAPLTGCQAVRLARVFRTTTPSSSRGSKRLDIARNSHRTVLPALKRPAPGGHGFVIWYKFEHRHSGIHYVTPAQRRAGGMSLSWRHVIRPTSRRANAIPHVGPVVIPPAFEIQVLTAEELNAQERRMFLNQSQVA